MGIIKEKITRDIQSQTSQGRVDSSKIEQAFAKYNLTVDEAKVQQELNRIITEKVSENNTTEVKKFLLGSVELTSLSTTDTEEHILAMVEKVNKFDSAYPALPHVATIVTYPNFAHLVRQTLEVDGVQIAVVSGSFPSSQTFMEIKVSHPRRSRKCGHRTAHRQVPFRRLRGRERRYQRTKTGLWQRAHESNSRNMRPRQPL